MLARIVIAATVAIALIGGAALYWLQVYAFYREVGPEEAGPVVLVPQGGAAPEPIPVSDFRAIDADSSPIRFRACFSLDEPPEALAAFQPYPDARPLIAPGWFDCFDAREIGEALEAGEARAYLSVKDIRYGIDRIVAVLPDGRGFSWHQINACGEVVFDGDPPPPGCPPVPDESRPEGS